MHGQRKKPWTGILIIAGASLPLFLALALGISAIQADAEQDALRLQRYLHSQLSALATHWQGAVDNLEYQLKDLCQSTSLQDTNNLLELSQNHPLIRQVFVIGPQGTIQWPPSDSQRQSEQTFLKRSASRFASPWFPGDASERGDLARTGWDGWYWDEGYQTFYWYATEAGWLCLELNRSAFLAQILNSNVPSPLAVEDRQLERVELSDATGQILQAWGNVEHLPASAAASLRLQNQALTGWQIDWYVADSKTAAMVPQQIGGLFALVAILILSSSAMAVGWRFYRRDLAQAGKRISFVNQVSHELKTPLTNIRLYSEMAQQVVDDDHNPDSPLGDYLAVIERESSRLSRLIRNVLTFGRPVPGQQLHIRQAYVHDVLTQTSACFQPSFAERGLRLDLDLATFPAYGLDTDCIDQIVGNLLSNAEKYAAVGQRVLLSACQQGPTIQIQVRDWGPGLPAGYHKHLFQAFERGHTKTSDAEGGTGLGLSISRDLARRHGGDLILDQHISPGCCFVLTIRPHQEPKP